MATIGTAVTLLDLASRLDPDNSIAAIIEVLADTNEILSDQLYVEGNLVTGHKTTIRSGIPTATWRKLNYGVQPTKSTTTQVTDTVGSLEAYAEVDKALADLNGNTAAFRMSEDVAHIEGINQQMADTLFYGDTTVNPERFVGLAPRFNQGSTDDTQSGFNIIDGGAAGTDNTSIWLVAWGANTVHGIYPRGSTAGLDMEDLGQVTLYDANNGRYEGYRTHYTWKSGLTVRDWRYVVRIANIDVSNVVSGASPDLATLMVRAIERLPTLSGVNASFYVNRTVRTHLRRQILAKSNVFLTFDNVAGSRILAFDGVPVRRIDAILTTESLVPGPFAAL